MISFAGGVTKGEDAKTKKPSSFKQNKAFDNEAFLRILKNSVLALVDPPAVDTGNSTMYLCS